MAFAPAASAIIAAYGAVKQGHDSAVASAENAQFQKNEQTASIDNANQSEVQVRRNSREALARQYAAFGAAGAGYGGSSGGALDESAQNQELDALNTRYKGALAGYGYGVQAGIDAQTGRTQADQGYMTAAGRLLAAPNGAYSSLNPFGGGGGSPYAWGN